MAQVINTNILSLNAQRNLNRSQSTLATSLQRLSSGLRVNSAKDDAAGLAISERFSTQIRGLDQAVRNANDGISLSQTAESALDEVVSNLQRIRELAVQSANATNSASDRAALDAEVQQRIAEIDRISSQTTFNGQKVLDGSFGTATFQVGANVGDTIDISLNTSSRSNAIGQIATDSATQTYEALNQGGLTVQIGDGPATSVGAAVAGNEAGQDANSAFASANAINAAGISGLTVQAVNEQSLTFADIDDGDIASYDLSINGVDIYSGFDGTAGNLTLATVVDQINVHAAETGVRAEVDGTNLKLVADDGRNINVVQDTTGAAAAQGITDTLTNSGTGAAVDFSVAGANTGTAFGDVTLSAAENITLTGEYDHLGFASDTIAVDSTTIDSVAVTTVDNANDAIQRVDSALTTVSALRSEFGAIQNRFESTIFNLETVSENLQASRSRIRDADFAAETAALTRAQILQQAGISILAQANAQPQNVLGLLR